MHLHFCLTLTAATVALSTNTNTSEVQCMAFELTLLCNTSTGNLLKRGEAEVNGSGSKLSYLLTTCAL